MTTTAADGTARFAPSRVARLALFLGLLGNAMGHAFLLASLPPLGRQLGLGDVETGVILSLGALGLLIAAPLWGLVAERWGRRPVLLIGLLVAALAPLAFAALAEARLAALVSVGLTFGLLLSVRLCQSLLTGGLLPAAQAYIADMTAADRRIAGMGLMAAAFGLGSVIGAATLWAVAEIGVPVGFYAVALVTGAAALAVWRWLPEPPRSLRPDGGAAARIPWAAIWPCLLITVLGVTTYALIQMVTALRVQDAFGLSPQQAAGQAGAVLTATAVSMVVAQAVVLQRLRWPADRVIGLGASLAIGAFVMLALADSLLIVAAAMVGLGLAIGLLLPANLAMLSLLTGAGAQAKVAGINAIGQGIGMVAGPALGALLYQLSPTTPFWASAGLLTLVFALSLALTVRRLSLRGPTPPHAPPARNQGADS